MMCFRSSHFNASAPAPNPHSHRFSGRSELNRISGAELPRAMSVKLATSVCVEPERNAVRALRASGAEGAVRDGSFGVYDANAGSGE